MKRIVSIILVVCLIMALLCACGDRTVNEGAEKTVVDMAGATVTLPEKIDKVICISPTITEYMIAFGLGDKLIGTHKNALNKVWLQEVYPQISELKAYSYSASAEEVLEVGADLVIVTQESVAEELRSAGICAVTVWLNDTKGPYSHVRILGEIFGEETGTRIEQWISEVEQVKKEINDKLSEENIQEGPSVYMINGQSNKGLFYPQGGGGSALESYITGIGAKYALHEFSALEGKMPTEEEILNTNPEVIAIGGAYGVPMREEILDDPVWADISAIKNNRVYIIPIGGIGWDQGYIALPVMLKFFANIFYPDVFQYDISSDGAAFYKKYFNSDLSVEDIENMMQDLTPEGTPAWE